MLPTEAHQLAGRLQRRDIPIEIQPIQTRDGQGDLIPHNRGEAGGGHEGSSRKGGVYTLIVPPQLSGGSVRKGRPPAKYSSQPHALHPPRRFEAVGFARIGYYFRRGLTLQMRIWSTQYKLLEDPLVGMNTHQPRIDTR